MESHTRITACSRARHTLRPTQIISIFFPSVFSLYLTLSRINIAVRARSNTILFIIASIYTLFDRDRDRARVRQRKMQKKKQQNKKEKILFACSDGIFGKNGQRNAVEEKRCGTWKFGERNTKFSCFLAEVIVCWLREWKKQNNFIFEWERTEESGDLNFH